MGYIFHSLDVVMVSGSFSFLFFFFFFFFSQNVILNMSFKLSVLFSEKKKRHLYNVVCFYS